jgi:hypothetical protein
VPHKACDTHGKEAKFIYLFFLLKYLKAADSLEGLGVDGKIKLKLCKRNAIGGRGLVMARDK